MHDTHLGQLGQGSTGSRFRIIGQKGQRVSCPSGTSQESSGRLGTGQQYVWCHRAPQFAPPPTTRITYEAPRTTVSPSLQTQISPQVSPALTQLQASPGAQVRAAPSQVAPAPMTRGITGADLERIMAAQRAASAVEQEAHERKRNVETEELRRQMAARSRQTEEIMAAQRAGEARRIEQERFAREQAEATARSAEAIPPPASFSPGTPLQAPIQAAAPIVAPMMTPAEQVVEVEGDALEAGMSPMVLVMIAAAGLGVMMLAGQKGKRRKRR